MQNVSPDEAVACSAAQLTPEQVFGSVRSRTTDAALHGLIAPALKSVHATHPGLSFDLYAGNELANLTRRDADLAVRTTKRRPQHLVGKHVDPIRVALFAAKNSGVTGLADAQAGTCDWIAQDDALPEHPCVIWRKRHYPEVSRPYRVSSILTVMQLVSRGMGVGLLPIFLTQERKDLV